MAFFSQQQLEADLPHFEHKFAYGTAGFRGKAVTLNRVMFASGCLSSLRCFQTKKAIGLMITASHNPAHDNGVKLVDPEGEMLSEEWEPLATELVNSPNAISFGEVLQNIIQKFNLTIPSESTSPLFIGYDTRESSIPLSELSLKGAAVLGQKNIINLGLVTTPILHFAVRQYNLGLPWNEDAYYRQLTEAYREAVGSLPAENFEQKVILDAANGVGAPKVLRFVQELGNLLPLEVRNQNGELNFKVGADYVKIQQKEPEGVDPKNQDDRNARFVTIDGDADRLLYFFFDTNDKSEPTFSLLDGDDIAALYLTGLIEDLKQLGVPLYDEKAPSDKALKVGVIQTAYANGASTHYFEKLGVAPSCVKTGVKHLLTRAQDFDVAIYFEANGHGSIAFTNEKKYLDIIREYLDTAPHRSSAEATAKRLESYLKLVNPAIGDALSGMLLAEAILRRKNWNLSHWRNLYKPLACRQLLVKVPNRYAITTTDAERIVVTPVELQPLINQSVQKVGSLARSFVRPSGTEDVVRVYAEAPSQTEADSLAQEIAGIVEKILNPKI